MLYGLMGALLNVKKSNYAVGEYAVFTVSGQPGAEILWSTWINGIEQERDMPYGDFIEDDGMVELLWADPFYGHQTGTWKRTITLLNPDGTRETATVTFTVGAIATTTPAPAPVYIAPRSGALDPFYSKPIVREDPPRTLYPTPLPAPQPLPLPPRDPVPTSPDILNPTPLPAPVPSRPPVLTPVPTAPVPIPAPTNGQIPARSLYPVGQDPRPAIDRNGDLARPVVTAPNILNPAPLPNLPSPLPAPIPPLLTPGQTPGQAPGQTSGGGLGGSIKIGGVDIPIWALVAIGAILLLKGGR